MGEDPDRIRREIEATREEMGETVDALSYKADVKSRARDSIVEKKESAKESLMGTKDSIKSKVVGTTDRVGEATPDREQVKQNARQAVGVAQENPLGLAIGSVAAGFIVGMLLPSSRVEDQKLGPIADEVKEKAKETGQEALQRGQQVAQEAAQSAQQTVQERGREESQELASSAQQNAQEAAQSAR
jgi:tetrahydromethanopterin S-methyltransferase subunit F